MTKPVIGATGWGTTLNAHLDTLAPRRATTDRTYYVATWGDDSNDGLSEGSPLKTLAAAVAKQPATNQTFNSTRRSTVIKVGPGDYHETSPIVINKAANLEIVGSGGRGGAGVGIYGGTTIYTPIGSVGITIGYRDDTNTSWLGSKGGCVVRNLQVRPDGTDTGGSTGIKVIGLSNCTFHDVAVADYQGTGSNNWHFQSHVIANGGSTGGTMYNELYSCTASRCTVGIRCEGAVVSLVGCLIDGNDDVISSTLSGSTGIVCTNGGGVYFWRLFMQSLDLGIDQSQSHGAGVVYPLVGHALRMESVKVGVRSNQLLTAIKGGSYYSGGLSGGTTGTIAFDMQAGAEFSVEDVQISGVETPVAVTSGAAGWRSDPAIGRQVWGSKHRGKAPGVYMGTAATSTGSTGGVPTVTLNASAGTSPTLVGSMGTANGLDTGSTDMQGRVVWTAGTTPGAGSQATVTFATAFAAGTKPIVYLNHETAGTNTVVNAISISNTSFQINFNATPGAGTHTVSYAIVGLTT